jgi:mannose-6-phosphate isomerase-like protein (cupin superfamily)|tara:strand:- start:2922 stop:3242 length:321 start_codon:yes stop_codon:yes gene_type:complete
MEKHNLNEMIKGWFVGDFEPSLYKTQDFEVAVKRYLEGAVEKRHTHKVATEFTVIVDGVVEMNGVEYSADDIIVIKPGESTDFKCLTHVTTVVVKTPCVKNDKYEE